MNAHFHRRPILFLNNDRNSNTASCEKQLDMLFLQVPTSALACRQRERAFTRDSCVNLKFVRPPVYISHATCYFVNVHVDSWSMPEHVWSALAYRNGACS
jgi:hypothetical protein